MFRSLLCTPIARPFFSSPLLIFLPSSFRFRCKRNYKCSQMGIGDINEEYNSKASLRLCNVSGYMTELLEIQAPNPTLHVLFIPGNPGIVTFYNEFLESLYELLEGKASVTAVGHISHSSKDWERGRLFSLQEQIDHKVGHSIGSHISIEIFKRYSHKVVYCIGLYPFLALNTKSSKQTFIRKLAESSVLSSLVSSIVGMLGLIPSLSRFVMKKTLGKSWSSTAVEAACSHLVKYHMMRNMLFMAMAEFKKFSDAPDWEFLRVNQGQLAFLFGIDDHWGPLSLFEEISKEAPDVRLSIEREGHDHAFSCTGAGSTWVAQYVASLIKKYTSSAL